MAEVWQNWAEVGQVFGPSSAESGPNNAPKLVNKSGRTRPKLGSTWADRSWGRERQVSGTQAPPDRQEYKERRDYLVLRSISAPPPPCSNCLSTSCKLEPFSKSARTMGMHSRHAIGTHWPISVEHRDMFVPNLADFGATSSDFGPLAPNAQPPGACPIAHVGPVSGNTDILRRTQAPITFPFAHRQWR